MPNFILCRGTSSLLCPNIFLSTLFSNILSECSSINVRNQVSFSYETVSFYVLLTVHLSIILVINQLNAQILVL